MIWPRITSTNNVCMMPRLVQWQTIYLTWEFCFKNQIEKKACKGSWMCLINFCFEWIWCFFLKNQWTFSTKQLYWLNHSWNMCAINMAHQTYISKLRNNMSNYIVVDGKFKKCKIVAWKAQKDTYIIIIKYCCLSLFDVCYYPFQA